MCEQGRRTLFLFYLFWAIYFLLISVRVGTWNADFVAGMEPKNGDIVIQGKRGLDAFPGTDLEAQLRRNNIKTVVLGGLLTNCCVESTMRTAFEKGFNVVTLKDCTAATSHEGQAAAAGPQGTWGMFSTTMTKNEFLDAIQAPINTIVLVIINSILFIIMKIC